MAVRRTGRSRKASRPRSSKRRGSSGEYLTDPQGERRAIILGMDYYLKLLSELNTLRALVKPPRQSGLARRSRRSGRPSSR